METLWDGSHLTKRIEDTREQQVVDNLAEIKEDYDAMRMTDAMEASEKRKKACQSAADSAQRALPLRFRTQIQAMLRRRQAASRSCRLIGILTRRPSPVDTQIIH